MPDLFLTQINGNACYCKVTHYRPYVPSRHMTGAMEDAEEGMDSEFSFELYTLEMQPATDPDYCFTQSDIDRFQDEWEAFVTASKYGKDF